MGMTTLRPGDSFLGKYRVEKQLGAGAMGVVYSLLHADLGQKFAVKILKPGAAEGEIKARFLREARASVRLKSEHVARVVDVGTTDEGAPFIVMEHLEGRDLSEEIQARGQLPFQEAVEYILQACEAVAEAHAAGIVHRDIKPANLFLTTGTGGLPRVKVLDFGVSKDLGDVGLTGSMVLGTPLYMAPEHMSRSADVDGRADVWALGVTLYHLVAGKTPFHADLLPVVCALVFEKAPAPLSTYRQDAPPGFEAVIGMCLEKDRARRMPSVAALAAALVPYGPPRAAMYAERAALALGEQVAMSRPTAELPPEPPPPTAAEPSKQPTTSADITAPTAGSPAVTAGPLARSTGAIISRRGVRWDVALVLIGAVVIGTVVGVSLIQRTPGPAQGIPGSGSADTAKPLVSPPSANPPSSSGTSAVPPVAPASAPEVRPVEPPPSASGGKVTAPRKVPPTTTAKPKRGLYDQ